MSSRSWEDDSRSWRLSWQRQRNLVISTNTPDGGNPEGAISWRTMIRGLRTRINNVRCRGCLRFNSVNGWIVYE